jgi:hypothetical protein
MSTEQRVIDADRAGLLSLNTIRQSQALTDKDKNLEPEDMRTRRFGYQPGFPLMEMHPRECGQQLGRIEPGVLTLFDLFSLKLQNPSVDASDPSGPVIDGESLPGHQVRNLMMQYREFGFRELLALRGMDNVAAVDLFFEAHPPLSFAVDQGIAAPCMYEGEDVDEKTGQREVCITCRRDLVDALLKSGPTDAVKALLLQLRECIQVGRAHMASEWAKVKSELNTKPNPGMAPTLGSLKDDHYFFMRQLHERTPQALEMEKSRQATIDTANIFKQAIGQQTDALGKAAAENAALAAMQQQMAAQERRFEEFKAQMAAKSSEPEAATAEAEKAPTAGKKAGK